jgi:hypothetical protein
MKHKDFLREINISVAREIGIDDMNVFKVAEVLENIGIDASIILGIENYLKINQIPEPLLEIDISRVIKTAIMIKEEGLKLYDAGLEIWNSLSISDDERYRSISKRKELIYNNNLQVYIIELAYKLINKGDIDGAIESLSTDSIMVPDKEVDCDCGKRIATWIGIPERTLEPKYPLHNWYFCEECLENMISGAWSGGGPLITDFKQLIKI